MKRAAAVMVVLLIASSSYGAKWRAARTLQTEWAAPVCQVTDLPWLRFAEPNGTVHRSSLYPAWPATNPLIMTVAAGAANTLWAVDMAGAIHRSDDAGCTWTVVAAVPEALRDEWDAGIAARHGWRVYVYTGPRYTPYDHAIVRITGGTIETFEVPDPHGFLVMEVDPADANHLLAIGRWQRTWESTDGAATWKEVGYAGMSVSEARAVSFYPRDFNHSFLATSEGLFESRDGGRSWTKSLPGEFDGVRFAPSDASVVYVGAVPSALLRSTDGGRSFATIDVAVRGPYSRLYYMAQFFAVSPTDPFMFASPGDRAVGVKITSPEGERTTSAYENVAKAIWAPNGYIYYTRSWVWLR